jgi:outer membrane lipoprotein carrier protein
MATMKRLLVAFALGAAAFAARADAADTLRAFVREVNTGKADFTQTVTSPDGAKKKTSSGHFEFARPDRFRFTYTRPFEQVIVGDGRKVWIYDADLNQVSSRKIGAALGATPAALLAGGSMDKDFELAALPDQGGLAWVKATPRAKDGAFQSLSIGFKGKELAAIDIQDSFGQHSRLDFSNMVANPALPDGTFVFTPPAGAEVIEQ